MSDESIHKQINVIVGAAVKALAECGAGDEFIGNFAAKHRTKVASVLGIAEHDDQPPDLLALVTRAVEMALANGAPVSKPQTSRRQRKTSTRFVTVDGRRTSLTLNTETLSKVEAAAGGKKQASAVVREMAAAAPSGVSNRSKWVEERLQGYLELSAASGSTQAH